MMIRRSDTAYSRLTVTLPTFVIVALREMVEGGEYSVSDLLTGWLLRSISKKDLLSVAAKHPEFKPIIKAWLRSEVRTKRQ